MTTLWTMDTNILCYTMQPRCPQYGACTRKLSGLKFAGQQVVMLSQTTVEFWHFLTRPAEGHRPGLALTPARADNELRRLEGLYPIWPDVPVIHAEWRRLVVDYSVSGVAVYDARLAAAAHMHGIPYLLTYNEDDFKRYVGFLTVVSPEGA